MVAATLDIWHRSVATYGLASIPGPLTPIMDNPDFPPGMNTTISPSSTCTDKLLVTHCLVGMTTPGFWFYLQLKDFLMNSKHKLAYCKNITQLEQICLSGSQIAKSTSLIYSWLCQPSAKWHNKSKIIWEETLGVALSEAQWEKDSLFAHKCSLSSRYQEISYKVLTQWYITPLKTKHWFPTLSDTCWRCHEEVGSFLHTWWSCPPVLDFWTQVVYWIIITDTEIPLDACLLNVNSLSIRKYKKTLTKHLLTAAKTLIPLHWRSSSSPTVKDWLGRVHHMFKMDEIIACCALFQDMCKSYDLLDKITNPSASMTALYILCLKLS